MSVVGESHRARIPVKTIMSFWRSRLNKILRQDVLLRRIIVDGKRLSFETESWDEYWKGSFSRPPVIINRLHETWKCLRASGFCKTVGQEFGHMYMEAIREAVKYRWPSDMKQRLLNLENAVICRAGSDEPLAAMTSNFRNPVLLLRQSSAAGSSHHNETLLLPLIAAGYGGKAHTFFHYRRQSLLRNTNDALLFFPRVDLSIRGESFRILQELVEVLVHEWDSRIEQRANLLASKVIAPLIPALGPRNKTISVLDVGSGAGLFTSRLIKRVGQSDGAETVLYDLTLMDQLSVVPDLHFREHSLRKSLVGRIT